MDVESFYCIYVGHNCDEATCPYYMKEKGRCAFEDHWDSEPDWFTGGDRGDILG